MNYKYELEIDIIEFSMIKQACLLKASLSARDN